MRALNANDILYLNTKEYMNFKKNVECRELTKEREKELRTVSNRFNKARKIHGNARFETKTGVK